MTHQFSLFKEPYPPELLPGHYLVSSGSLATIKRLPYRKEVFKAIEKATSQGFYVPSGIIADQIPGESFYDVVMRHIDRLVNEGSLDEMKCYYGAEEPWPERVAYKGFQNLYQWREEPAE